MMAFAVAVTAVAKDGVARFSKVDPDLIATPGLKGHVDGGDVIHAAFDPVVSDCVLTRVSLDGALVQAPIGGKAAGKRTRIGNDTTGDNGQVFSLGFVLFELADDCCRGFPGLAEHQKTGGVAIEAMDHIGLGAPVSEPPQIEGQRSDKGMVFPAFRRHS